MSSTERQALDLGCVVVRYAPSEPPSPARAQQDLALLSREERERYRRQTDARRAEFCSAHALLRRTLSLYADLEPPDWRFASDPMGKPAIVNPPADAPLTFNLSHTRGLVACVVSRETALGVDVESSQRPRSYSLLADRVLAPGEREAWKNLPVSEQAGRFLDYWTLKEAHLKAQGTGIRSRLDALEFSLEGADGAGCRVAAGRESADGGCHYLRLRPTPIHFLAVACAGNRAPGWDVGGVDL